MIGSVLRCAFRGRRLPLITRGLAQTFTSLAGASAPPAMVMPMHTDDGVIRSMLKRRPQFHAHSYPVSTYSSCSSLPTTVSYATTNISRKRFSTSKCDGNGGSSTKQSSPTQQTKSFLLSLGYTDEVSAGIIDALLQNGIPSTSLLSMVKGLAGRYEVGEDGGLEALAASVQQELDKDHGKAKVKVWCLPSTGWSPAEETDYDDDHPQKPPIVHSLDRAFAVEAIEGTTLTDVAKFGTSDNCDVLGEYLECACSGIMACSTCHVVIHPDWYDSDANNHNDPHKVGPPCEAEQDMIDLAYEPQATSRLGCQIKLTKELDGLQILLPRGSNNLMDFVPFDD